MELIVQWVIPSMEIITAYCENDRKRMKTLGGKGAEFFNVEACGTKARW
jgi:hypothetical protein